MIKVLGVGALLCTQLLGGVGGMTDAATHETYAGITDSGTHGMYAGIYTNPATYLLIPGTPLYLFNGNSTSSAGPAQRPAAQAVDFTSSPQVLERVWRKGKLVFGTGLLDQSVSSRALAGGTEYLQVRFKDQTNQRVWDEANSKVFTGRDGERVYGRIELDSISPHDANLISENARLTISLRQPKFIGPDPRLGATVLELRPLIARLLKGERIEVSVPPQDLKLSLWIIED